METRIGRVIGAKLTERGWHATATLGHFGAAAAAGRLLHLNAGQLAHALGIAGTQATGLLASFGTMSKPLHPGKAAMNGLLAALLAREGFTGSMAMLDGPGGLSETYLGISDLSAAVEDFGKRWQLLDNSTKFYAACHLVHATVDAARGIRASGPLAAEAIERVECRVHPLVLKAANQRNPQTDLEAKFSIGFCAAIALLRGDAGEAEFNAASIADPDVARVMARVTPEPDPAMPVVAAHMTVRLTDGRVLEQHVSAARGTAQNPPSRDDVEEKFRRLAGVVLPAERVSGLVAALRVSGRAARRRRDRDAGRRLSARRPQGRRLRARLSLGAGAASPARASVASWSPTSRTLRRPRGSYQLCSQFSIPSRP